jgi:hypothetical protein
VAAPAGQPLEALVREELRGPSPERTQVQHHLDADRYWNEHRRALIEQASVSAEARDGRTFVVRHLTPQFGAV